jgi:hypothetical protein
MGDLDDGLLRAIGPLLRSRREEPRVDQGADELLGFLRQVLETRRLAHALAVVEAEADEMRHECVTQRIAFVVGQLASAERLVGGAPHRIEKNRPESGDLLLQRPTDLALTSGSVV